MKTEWKRTELSSTTFFFIFFAEAEMDTETPETNMKTNINGNRHGPNMAWTWTKSG
jgi:hypothetical protein